MVNVLIFQAKRLYFMYVKKFEDLNKSDIPIAGGKGANLGELTQAGIPVPPGFVVTAQTYEKFMVETGINDQVLSILEEIDINDTKALQAAAEEIKAIIVEGTGADETKITAEASFKEDLGLDSLDLFELVMKFEDEFGVEIPTDDLEQITTVGALMEYIEKLQ